MKEKKTVFSGVSYKSSFSSFLVPLMMMIFIKNDCHLEDDHDPSHHQPRKKGKDSLEWSDDSCDEFLKSRYIHEMREFSLSLFVWPKRFEQKENNEFSSSSHEISLLLMMIKKRGRKTRKKIKWFKKRRYGNEEKGKKRLSEYKSIQQFTYFGQKRK